MDTPPKRHVLVIGYPDFLPRHLAHVILEREPESTLYLIVAEGRMKEARTAIKKLSKTARNRVVLYMGDLSALDMGLSGREYLDLVGRVTHVYHAGMSFIMRHPERYLYERNVVGTQNLLNLCVEAPHMERLYFFSSLYVSGLRKGYIREREFDRGQKFKSFIEFTWYKAEKIVRHQRHRMGITVLRLGNVIGDSRTGEIDGFDGPYLLLSLLKADNAKVPLVLPGACKAASHLVPVDFVVDASYHISLREDSVGETYHITDPHSVPVHRAIKMVTTYVGRGQPRFGLPWPLFRTLYTISGARSLVRLPLDIFTYFNHQADYSTANLSYALQDTDIHCPEFAGYFPITIEYAVRRLMAERDRRDEQEAHDPLDTPQFVPGEQ